MKIKLELFHLKELKKGFLKTKLVLEGDAIVELHVDNGVKVLDSDCEYAMEE